VGRGPTDREAQMPCFRLFPVIEESNRARARALLEATTEVAVLAQIDLRVEDSRKDQAVLEKIVSRRRFGGTIGYGSLRGQPGDEALRANDG